MKTIQAIVQAAITACVIILIGGIGLRLFYADRISPHVYIGAFPVGGSKKTELPKTLRAYQQQLERASVTIAFRGRKSVHTLHQFGVAVNIPATQAEVIRASRMFGDIRTVRVNPVLTFQGGSIHALLVQDFAQVLSLPKNADIAIDAQYQVSIAQSEVGEDFNITLLEQAIMEGAGKAIMPTINAIAQRADPTVTAQQIIGVQGYAQSLLQSGFTLKNRESSFVIPRADVVRMVQVASLPSPHLVFQQGLLQEYLELSIAPDIHTEPVNARFQMQDGVVTQFALPKNGVDVDVDATMKGIADALMQQRDTASVITIETQPAFADAQSSASLGITNLIATGESDFRGSPKNRIHNIGVGAEKFNGILVAPGEEFSFVALLGPVDKNTGYLPELVIKNNATIPEYGGGLCQVSTTVFRAAMNAGVKITERHNHSYAVRYYGTPGFDATIYPPYTDFRFLNNTPGYLLIQTRIDGTKLFFEFWGTNDGRQATIDGPHPYNRMPDGSVKAVLKRTVIDAQGNEIENNTFNSNYKSPNLFPHESAKQASNSAATTTGTNSSNGDA